MDPLLLHSSFYVIKQSPKRIQMLYQSDELEDIVYPVFKGTVTKPASFSRSKGNPFQPGDKVIVAMSLATTEPKTYPKLFKKGEYCCVDKRLIGINGDDFVIRGIAVPPELPIFIRIDNSKKRTKCAGKRKYRRK